MTVPNKTWIKEKSTVREEDLMGEGKHTGGFEVKKFETKNNCPSFVI